MTIINLHLQTVPARQGLAWIRHGLTVFRRRPLAMSSLCSFAIMLVLVLPQLIPPLGLIVPLLPPLISLGFMLATHEVLQGNSPKIGVFVAPLRITAERRKSQLLLCLFYALAQLLIMLLTSSLFGDSLDRLSDAKAAGDQTALLAAASDPRLRDGMLTLLLLESLVSIPFWHAPALVHWGGQGVAQALFSSTVALWRNRGAFALNALGFAGAVIAVALLLAPIIGLLGPQLGTLFTVLSSIVVSTVFYSSLYFSFVDCFLSGSPDKLTFK